MKRMSNFFCQFGKSNDHAGRLLLQCVSVFNRIHETASLKLFSLGAGVFVLIFTLKTAISYSSVEFFFSFSVSKTGGKFIHGACKVQMSIDNFLYNSEWIYINKNFWKTSENLFAMSYTYFLCWIIFQNWNIWKIHVIWILQLCFTCMYLICNEIG